jgi:hypothetical protein
MDALLVTGHRRPRLNRAGLLGLMVLCASACGTKEPAVTGLVATISLPSFPPGVDQISIGVSTAAGEGIVAPEPRPKVASAPLASPQSVTIYLPDSLVGMRVVCEVTALVGGQPTGARGRSEPVQVVLDRLVHVDVDVRAPDPTDAAQPDGEVEDAGPDADDDGPGSDVSPEVPAGDAPRANGQACAVNAECESSLCVAGLCCDSPCGGTCFTCALPGKEGTCSPKPSGAPSSCADQGAESCDFNGRCDGNGACQRYEAGMSCKPAACTTNGAGFMPSSACDGQGTCEAANVVDCAPYVCDPTGASPTCPKTCRAGAADCVAPAVCVDGSCGPKPLKALGAGCVDGGDCASGHCADGVCCGAACTGACVSCNQAGFLGMCRPVAAQKPDPHAVCKDGGAAACGQSGLCNGAGACAVYAAGTVCLAGTCNGRMVRNPKRCDGKGACVAAADIDCLPYRCNPATTACFTSCTTDQMCSSAPRRSCRTDDTCG